MKNAIVAVAIVAVAIAVSTAKAEEAPVIYGADFQFNLKSPEGEDFTAYEVATYAIGKDLFGGIDVGWATDSGHKFYKVEPYVGTKLNETWSIRGGGSINRANEDFVFGAVCYKTTMGKMFLLVEVANDFPVSEVANGQSYIDVFGLISYTLTKNISVGLEMYYDYWWNNYTVASMIGPTLAYKINENATIFTRVSSEWFTPGEGEETRSTVGRLELRYKF